MSNYVSDLTRGSLRAVIVTVMTVAVAAWSADRVAAQTGLEEVMAEGTATLGIANEPPWMQLEPDGTATGVGPDLDRAILAHIGVETVYGEVMEYGALIPAVQAHRVTMATSGGLYINPERCQAVLFSEPVMCVGEGFVVRAELADRIDSYGSVAAEGLILGVCAGCVYESHAIERGVSPDNIVYWPDGTSAMKMLQDGRIDVIAHDSVSAIDLQNKSSRPELTAVTLANDWPAGCAGAVFSKDDADLRDAYNEGLAGIIADGTYEAIFAGYDLADLAKARHGSTAEFCAAN